MNHSNDGSHREKTVHFSDAVVAAGDSDRVTSMKEIELLPGGAMVSSSPITEVESSTDTRRYIIDDSLTFRITKIVVHSV